MPKTVFSVLMAAVVTLALFAACEDSNPPRDEIPAIKKMMADLTQAVKSRDVRAVDSLLSGDASSLGYTADGILTAVFPDDDSRFHAFGRWDFFYTEKKGVVNCAIMADSADTGRGLEITIEKQDNRWLVRRFDLK